MSAHTVPAGSDITPYTQPSPADHHRRKRNQSPPPSAESTQQVSSGTVPETPVHQRRMLTQPSEWTGGAETMDGGMEKRVHWTNIPSPEHKKKRQWLSFGRRKTSATRLSSGTSLSGNSLLSSRNKNLLTYLFFILMIGINIYIIAQSFFSPRNLGHQVMRPSERKRAQSLESVLVKESERKSFKLDEYYASRDSPMFCDLCPSGDQFCKDIGYVMFVFRFKQSSESTHLQISEYRR